MPAATGAGQATLASNDEPSAPTLGKNLTGGEPDLEFEHGDAKSRLQVERCHGYQADRDEHDDA